MAFLERALAWFAGLGVTVERVMTDNGSAYVSHAFRKACDTARSSTSAPGPTRPGDALAPVAARQRSAAEPILVLRDPGSTRIEVTRPMDLAMRPGQDGACITTGHS